MASELIPPVPNTEFKSPDNVRTWWDWFRKMRTNINTFATNITSIIAQITAVNAVGSGSISGGQTWTTASSFSATTVNIATMTTTGSSVTLIGNVEETVFTTGATTAQAMVLSILVKRDSTTLGTRNVTIVPIQYTTPTSWGAHSIGFTFLDTPLVAGTYTYTLTVSVQTLDGTGAVKNTSGEIYYNYYFVLRENKT